jgi:hypothetical protein
MLKGRQGRLASVAPASHAFALCRYNKLKRRSAMTPEANTEPTVCVELNLPQSAVRQLDTLAERSGKGRDGVIVELLQSIKPVTLAEVVRPLHENFRQSGMTEDQIDTLIEEELKAVRANRRARQAP